MYKFAYLVSGNGGLLQTALNILPQIQSFSVDLVIADRKCHAVERARRAGVQTKEIAFENYRSREDYSGAILETLSQHSIDGVITTFNRILSDPLLSAYEGRLANIHFALLPLFPGLRPIRKALNENAKFAGVTIHRITKEVDAGPVLAQCVLPIRAEDSEESLGRRLFEAAVPMQLQVMHDMATGHTAPSPDVHTFGDRLYSPPLEAVWAEMGARALLPLVDQ